MVSKSGPPLRSVFNVRGLASRKPLPWPNAFQVRLVNGCCTEAALVIQHAGLEKLIGLSTVRLAHVGNGLETDVRPRRARRSALRPPSRGRLWRSAHQLMRKAARGSAHCSRFVLATAAPTQISSLPWLDAQHHMRATAQRAALPHALRVAVVAASAATAATARLLTRPTLRLTRRRTPRPGAAEAVGVALGAFAAPQSRAGRVRVRLPGTHLNKYRRSRRFGRTWRA